MKLRVEFDTREDMIKFLEWKLNLCIYPVHTFTGIKTDESFYLEQDAIKVRKHLSELLIIKLKSQKIHDRYAKTFHRLAKD